MKNSNDALSAHKVAIITGAGAGIGKACALRFAQEGYHIVVADLSEQAVEQSCKLINDEGGASIACVGDISKEETSRRMSNLAMESWGRIDALVANAGVQIGGELLQSNEEDWDRILGVNLKGVAYSCKSVLPAMIDQKNGSIVMISSINALIGSAGMAIYDASKAAILALMRNLAVEYGSRTVRVNAICPGNTITDYHIDRMAERGIDEQQLREMMNGYALLGRAAEPAEIANAVFFLASDQASFITGQTLLVDGGFSVTSGTR